MSAILSRWYRRRTQCSRKYHNIQKNPRRRCSSSSTLVWVLARRQRFWGFYSWNPSILRSPRRGSISRCSTQINRVSRISQIPFCHAECSFRIQHATVWCARAAQEHQCKGKLNTLIWCSDYLQVPTLVVVGRYDNVTPVSSSEEIAKGIPFARLEIFEHSGHSPPADEPEKFSQIISDFLESRVMSSLKV